MIQLFWAEDVRGAEIYQGLQHSTAQHSESVFLQQSMYRRTDVLKMAEEVSLTKMYQGPCLH